MYADEYDRLLEDIFVGPLRRPRIVTLPQLYSFQIGEADACSHGR